MKNEKESRIDYKLVTMMYKPQSKIKKMAQSQFRIARETKKIWMFDCLLESKPFLAMF